jgi:hypothetical protein
MPKTFPQGKVGRARYDSTQFRRESTPQTRLSAIGQLGRLARCRALGRFDFRVGFHVRQLAQECEVAKPRGWSGPEHFLGSGRGLRQGLALKSRKEGRVTGAGAHGRRLTQWFRPGR